MIDKLLVSVVSFILITAVAVQLFLYGLPVFTRIEFDAICHSFVQRMDQSGGLNETDQIDLLNRLKQSGFLDISVTATREAQYGEDLNLSVAAACPGHRLTVALNMEEVLWRYTYEASITCRVFKQYVAVQSVQD